VFLNISAVFNATVSVVVF